MGRWWSTPVSPWAEAGEASPGPGPESGACPGVQGSEAGASLGSLLCPKNTNKEIVRLHFESFFL